MMTMFRRAHRLLALAYEKGQQSMQLGLVVGLYPSFCSAITNVFPQEKLFTGYFEREQGLVLLMPLSSI